MSNYLLEKHKAFFDGHSFWTQHYTTRPLFTNFCNQMFAMFLLWRHLFTPNIRKCLRINLRNPHYHIFGKGLIFWKQIIPFYLLVRIYTKITKKITVLKFYQRTPLFCEMKHQWLKSILSHWYSPTTYKYSIHSPWGIQFTHLEVSSQNWSLGLTISVLGAFEWCVWMVRFATV